MPFQFFMESMMKKPLAILIAGLAMSSLAPAQAALPSPADMKARQQMVQSMTEGGDDTSGARATALQDAQNVAVSRGIPSPTIAERRTDVIAAAVYPQAGPSAAALGAKNTAVSKDLAKATVKLGTPAAEQWLQKEATP
jgi:hypothetical protein